MEPGLHNLARRSLSLSKTSTAIIIIAADLVFSAIIIVLYYLWLRHRKQKHRAIGKTTASKPRKLQKRNSAGFYQVVPTVSIDETILPPTKPLSSTEDVYGSNRTVSNGLETSQQQQFHLPVPRVLPQYPTRTQRRASFDRAQSLLYTQRTMEMSPKPAYVHFNPSREPGAGEYYSSNATEAQPVTENSMNVLELDAYTHSMEQTEHTPPPQIPRKSSLRKSCSEGSEYDMQAWRTLGSPEFATPKLVVSRVER